MWGEGLRREERGEGGEKKRVKKITNTTGKCLQFTVKSTKVNLMKIKLSCLCK